MEKLEPGDFLYQSDQELFLVVVEENDDSYTFAVHGWRTIGKDRVVEYLDDPRSKIYSKSEVDHIVNDRGDEETQRKFESLKKVFTLYKEKSLSDEQMRFSMDDGA